jgi:hypothetical protein
LWQSEKQSSTLLSSTEAEYIAMTEVTKELLWFKNGRQICVKNCY